MSTIHADFFYNALYQLVRVIAPLLVAPYISRVIGAEGIGAYAYTFSIADYFVICAMLGIRNYGNRSVAAEYKIRERASRVFWNTYYVQVCSSLLVLIAYLLYAGHSSESLHVITYCQIIYVVSAFLEIDWFFYGLQQFKLIAVRGTIIKALSVVAVFLFVKTKDDLAIYTIIMAGGFLISPLFLWPSALKRVTFVKPDWKMIQKSLKPILMLFVPVVAVSIYRIMGKIMLGMMTDMEQVGYYENADKIIGVSLGILIAFGNIMLPRMSYLMAENEIERANEYIKKSMEFVMYVASALAFGIIGVSPHFVIVFFGPHFLACSPLMTGLAVTILFWGWASVIRTQYLIPTKRDRLYIISVSIGALVNLCLNLLLIPRYKAQGAVIATILAEMAVALYQTLITWKQLEYKTHLRNSIFPLALGGGMCVGVRYLVGILRPSVGALLIEILFGVGVFALSCLLYACINKHSLLATTLKRFRGGKCHEV